MAGFLNDTTHLKTKLDSKLSLLFNDMRYQYHSLESIFGLNSN